MKNINDETSKETRIYSVGTVSGQKHKTSDIYVCKNSRITEGEHYHDCYEIEIVIKGELEEYINGTLYNAKPGDAFFVFPDNMHNVIAKEKSTIYNIMFRLNVLDSSFLNDFWIYDSSTPICAHLSSMDFEFVSVVLEEAISAYQKHDDFSNTILKCVINLVVSKILSVGNVKLKSADPNMDKAIIYINEHLGEEITLNDVAKEIGLTPSYFSALFRHSTHCSFKRYINSRRLQAARNDLLESNLSVADICFKNGFTSLSTFYREFQSTFKQAPLDCRKNGKE